MSLVVNTNVASLSAQRFVGATNSRLGGNVARLASGLRIVQAADDAAGLGISERLKAQIAGLVQASRNANDAVSMIQVAEGSMNEQASILVRLRELAVQAANGTLGSVERGFLDAERDQLVQELDRIAQVTEFGGINMLSGAVTTLSFQVGIQSATANQISAEFSAVDSSSLGIGSISFTSNEGALSALDVIDTAISNLSSERASLGAVQNRLVITMATLRTTQENLAAANSRIRDVDVAEETASMTRNQILSQAGVAVLAQANQLPSLALSLIR